MNLIQPFFLARISCPTTALEVGFGPAYPGGFLRAKRALQTLVNEILFTPCVGGDSSVEPMSEAARNAAFGDVVLLSPAVSSVDKFQAQQKGDE